MELPVSVWKNVVAYLMEQTPVEDVTIPWASLNAVEQRVDLEADGDGDNLRLSTVDIDEDATDAPAEAAL